MQYCVCSTDQQHTGSCQAKVLIEESQPESRSLVVKRGHQGEPVDVHLH